MLFFSRLPSYFAICGFIFSGSSCTSQAQIPKKSPILTCSEVRARVSLFLDSHYKYRSFDNELSERTYEKLFEAFDPGKFYFLQQDLEKFSAIRDKIDDNILKADCGFVFEVQKVFVQRVQEASQLANSLLEKPFSFKEPDEMAVGKQKWNPNLESWKTRWEKRIKFQVLNLKDADGGEPKARERLKKRYLQLQSTLTQQTEDEILNTFLNAFARSLDPHSSHLLPVEQEEFAIHLGNKLEGIGATLQEIDGYITVQAIIPGGAAHRDGNLKVDDKIITVDPGDGSGVQDLIDLDLSKAVRFIRGKKGTTVKLTLLRKSEQGPQRVTLSLVRDSVRIASSEAASDILKVNNKKIGVIRLESFYTDFDCRRQINLTCAGSSGHILKEINRLKERKVDGLILDLRNNGGGDLPESIRISGFFIPEGTVLQTVDRKRVVRSLVDMDPSVQYDGPLAVLINRYSASASEIVAGAIQDYGRGLIIGDSQTFGKATVQAVQDLPGSQGRQSDGAIKVTQNKFYRPSGNSNQEVGVKSDVQLPSVLDVYDIGEKEEDYVLKTDTIKPSADFRPEDRFKKLLPSLAERSQNRIKASKEFKELLEVVEKAKNDKNKTTVSLADSEAQKSGDTSKSATNPNKNAKNKEKPKKKQNGADPEIRAVVKEDDIILTEAGHILVDAMELAK